MEKQVDGNTASVGNAQRRLSQIKVLSRLIEHEIASTKSAKDVTLDRELVENILDMLELYTEDQEPGGPTGKRMRGSTEAKPAVTRLN